jgi:hypothetical protein
VADLFLSAVECVDDIRQMETKTADLLVLEPSYFEAEIAIECSKRCKMPGIDGILAELVQREGQTLRIVGTWVVNHCLVF